MIMPIVRGILRNTDQFRQLLADTLVPSIFASVETGPNNQIMCLDSDRNLMMEFSDRPNGSSTAGYYRVYRSPNDFVTLAEVNQVINNAEGNETNYIGCENGIIVQGIATTSNGYGYYMHFMITKTNNGMPAYIGIDFLQGGINFDKPFRHIAYGDNPSFNTTTPSVREVGTQTVLQASHRISRATYFSKYAVIFKVFEFSSSDIRDTAPPDSESHSAGGRYSPIK